MGQAAKSRLKTIINALGKTSSEGTLVNVSGATNMSHPTLLVAHFHMDRQAGFNSVFPFARKRAYKEPSVTTLGAIKIFYIHFIIFPIFRSDCKNTYGWQWLQHLSNDFFLALAEHRSASVGSVEVHNASLVFPALHCPRSTRGLVK